MEKLAWVFRADAARASAWRRNGRSLAQSTEVSLRCSEEICRPRGQVFSLGKADLAGRLPPMLDSADARRRWAGVFCLAAAAGMLIWGRTVFEHRLAGATFLLYWLVCFGFTFSAIFLALRDVSAVRRRAREEQRRLIERALA